MDATAIDQIQLNFNPQGLLVINAAIGLMMLGVALDLKLDDFKRIVRAPKAPVIGLTAQFILLPAFTFLLTLLIRPHPSMALGMILVAACPGGNLSNIMTYLARGNSAISISMTAVSTVAAIIMTPLNLAVWGSLNPATAPILERVQLSPFDVFVTVFVILGITIPKWTMHVPIHIAFLFDIFGTSKTSTKCPPPAPLSITKNIANI